MGLQTHLRWDDHTAIKIKSVLNKFRATAVAVEHKRLHDKCPAAWSGPWPRRLGCHQETVQRGGDSIMITALVHWLGKFHPALVGFPVAMLVVAAVAELCLMVTGHAIYNAASRFCVCVAVIAAWVGAVTGWFFGGLHMTDQDWVMTTHRWLGTAVAAWVLPILIFSERSHRTGDRRCRRRFRVTLFVGALLVCVTGYFGGALVYGLDHYAW